MPAFIGWNPLYQPPGLLEIARYPIGLPALTYALILNHQCFFLIYVAVATNKASLIHTLVRHGKPKQAIVLSGLFTFFLLPSDPYRDRELSILAPLAPHDAIAGWPGGGRLT